MTADLLLRIIHDETLTYAECANCGAHLGLPALTGQTIRGPRDLAADLIVRLGTLTREELHVITLSTKNRIMDASTVYRGNVSTSLVRVGELFRAAVQLDGAGIILAHNHPSGDPTPSSDDLHLTAETVAAGRLLDVPVLDHLIIGRDAFVSMREMTGVEFDNPGGRR
jgi:DNA repair protein RadC